MADYTHIANTPISKIVLVAEAKVHTLKPKKGCRYFKTIEGIYKCMEYFCIKNHRINKSIEERGVLHSSSSVFVSPENIASTLRQITF